MPNLAFTELMELPAIPWKIITNSQHKFKFQILVKKNSQNKFLKISKIKLILNAPDTFTEST